MPRSISLPHQFTTLTRSQSRTLDHAAASELGIPTILLMEHAAASLEHHTVQLLDSIAPDRHSPTAHAPSPTAPPTPDLALIFCGPGNNGGDGYALARRLHLRGISVEIIAVGPPPKPGTDAAINRDIAQRMGLPIRAMTAAPEPARELEALLATSRRVILIDALLGTGASRPLDPAMSLAVQCINHLRSRHGHTRTLAVDLPTGLDADTGFPLGFQHFPSLSATTAAPGIVRADLTITLAALKPGLVQPHATPYTGMVEVGPIGVPEDYIARFAARAATRN